MLFLRLRLVQADAVSRASLTQTLFFVLLLPLPAGTVATCQTASGSAQQKLALGGKNLWKDHARCFLPFSTEPLRYTKPFRSISCKWRANFPRRNEQEVWDMIFSWCSLILSDFCIAMVMDRGFLHNFSLFICTYKKRLSTCFQPKLGSAKTSAPLIYLSLAPALLSGLPFCWGLRISSVEIITDTKPLFIHCW